MKRSEIKRRPLADTVLATLEPDTKEYREHDGNSWTAPAAIDNFQPYNEALSKASGLTPPRWL